MVITDIEMPDNGGFSLKESVRHIGARHGEAKFVALPGSGVGIYFFSFYLMASVDILITRIGKRSSSEL